MDLRNLKNETYGVTNKELDVWFFGIGGLLLIPFVILLIITGIHWLRLIGDLLPIITENQWATFATPGSEKYHPSWRPKLIFDIFAILSLVIYGTFTVWAFLRNKSYTPNIMIVWFILITVITAINYYYILEHMFLLFDYRHPEMVHGEYRYVFMQSAFWSMIGIIYFLFSKRVKATFIK